MQDFLLDGKACSDNTAFENVLSYYLSAIILSRLTIAIMSLIKFRFDISNLLSTKKKPCRVNGGVFY